MSLTIDRIGVYLPEQCQALQHLALQSPLNSEEVKVYQRFYGLGKVAISDVSLEEMIIRAAQEAISKSQFSSEDIACLIHAHTAPETWPYPNGLLTKICRRLGLRNAHCLAVHSNNCASTLNGLMTSRNYLQSSSAKAVLMVTADLTFSGILQQIPNTTICGDGASACVLSLDGEGAAIRSLEMCYYGNHSRGSWQSAEEQAEFESLYAGRLAEVMQRALVSAGLTWPEIRWVFPHNVNAISWREVAGRLGIPMTQIFLENLSEYGHCFGADIFINWNTAQNRLHCGDYIMVATVGLGAVFGAAVFQVSKGKHIHDKA
ncbi:ketoacyl-ACP synthase III family protein [Vibrio ruber]|uniref:ketoacyl-ACP synthase III family protein n=1 Tax=Vibrio ruber TaxID=184755 RepID=UPI00289307F9|nr:ketoacyl-ACP synthase III family protein [Vibrio ruber]WNJ94728.1 ketoacyl-ACP synthase III family protein [Vibrio ruber]